MIEHRLARLGDWPEPMSRFLATSYPQSRLVHEIASMELPPFYERIPMFWCGSAATSRVATYLLADSLGDYPEQFRLCAPCQVRRDKIGSSSSAA